MNLMNTDSPSWDAFLNKMPDNRKDIYFTSGYHKLYEINGEGTGKCFAYSAGGDVALYPFMMRRIESPCLDGTYFDVESAYGYGGPLVTSTDEDFLYGFEKAWLDYCHDSRIIAEFVRFHPLIANQNVFINNIEISFNRTTAFIDLTKGAEKIWAEDISSKNRNMIRKASSGGVRIEETKDWEAFQVIYGETMNRLQADDYYYFRDEYFQRMRDDPAYTLLGAFMGGRLIAGAVFIHYGGYFHYHLAGSDINYLKYAPNNLLLWEAIQFAVQKGSKAFHLGGGRTRDPEDSLLKYKSSFTKSFSEFYIGKRVHNAGIYAKLIEDWQLEHQKPARLFLQYRLP